MPKKRDLETYWPVLSKADKLQSRTEPGLSQDLCNQSDLVKVKFRIKISPLSRIRTIIFMVLLLLMCEHTHQKYMISLLEQEWPMQVMFDTQQREGTY